MANARSQSISFRQLEALLAIAQTGSFVGASRALNTSQPAISKRITELELALGFQILLRSNRNSRLTLRGEAIVEACQRIIDLRDQLLQATATPSEYSGAFRMGVTELVSLTALPDLIKLIRESGGRMKLEPVVGLTDALLERLVSGSISLAIIPSARIPDSLVAVPFGVVEFAWMCASEGFDCPERIDLADLGRYQLLAQSSDSGLQRTLNGWLKAQDVSASMSLSSNSLSALCQLTISGLGLSCLPQKYYSRHVRSGQLRMVSTNPSPPSIEYSVVYRKDRLLSVSDWIATLCAQLRWNG